MFCLSCGHNLPDDARFCSSCGRPVALDGSEPEGGVPPTDTDFDAALRAKDWSKAIELGERLLALAPTNKLTRTLTSEAYTNQANILEQDRWDEAATQACFRMASRANELDAENVDALFVLERNAPMDDGDLVQWEQSLQRRREYLDRAISLLTRQLDQHNSDSKLLTKRAVAYRRKAFLVRGGNALGSTGRTPEIALAIMDAQNAIAGAEGASRPFEVLTDIYFVKQEFRQALRVINEGLQVALEPSGQLQNLKGIACVRLAEHVSSEEERDSLLVAALEAFTSAISVGDDSHGDRGRVHLKMGAFDKALQDFTQAATFALSHGGMGWSGFEDEVGEIMSAFLRSNRPELAEELARSYVSRLTPNEVGGVSESFSIALCQLLQRAMTEYAGDLGDFVRAPFAEFIQDLRVSWGSGFAYKLLGKLLAGTDFHEYVHLAQPTATMTDWLQFVRNSPAIDSDR